jgi:hypothetical protein
MAQTTEEHAQVPKKEANSAEREEDQVEVWLDLVSNDQ